MVIRFDFSRFRSTDPKATVDLLVLIEQLVQDNVEYLRVHPETPKVYESGVAARTYSVVRCHRAVSIPEALNDKRASALSLAAWRCAEYRVQGTQARVFLKQRMSDWEIRLSFHILLPGQQEPSEAPFDECRDEKSSEVEVEVC